MDYVSIVFKAIDAPLVVGMVMVIQMLKKVIKINSKWYMLINMGAGFLAAWLKVDITKGGFKQFVIQGLIYGAANEFVYQSWRTIMSSLKKEKK